jgi:hypothetical protein
MSVSSGGVPLGRVTARQGNRLVWLGLAAFAAAWGRCHLICHWISGSLEGLRLACDAAEPDLRQDKLTMAERVGESREHGGTIPCRGFLPWSRGSWSWLKKHT